jgi:hypothetical protein
VVEQLEGDGVTMCGDGKQSYREIGHIPRKPDELWDDSPMNPKNSKKEKTCEDCQKEDEYNAWHRFPPIERECGKCIAEKVMDKAFPERKKKRKEMEFIEETMR